MNNAIRAPSTMSLLCLEASARTGSFTAAATELRLTQSAVSRQIQTLESRLGVRLFERRREALTLTEAGRYYLGEVEPLLRRLDRATANVMALQGRGGELALSAGASIGTYWLIPRLPSFTRAHGEITLNLATRVGPVDFRNLAVDASLEFGDGERPGLRNEFVLPLELSPFASPAWIVANGKSLDERTPRSALIQHRTLPGAWESWFELRGEVMDAGRDGPRYDIMSMALNAAVAGMGAVLLPPFLSEDMVAAGRLKPLSKRRWRHPKGYFLVYPETSAHKPGLKVFRDWLLSQAGA